MPFHAIVQCWTLLPPFGWLISSWWYITFKNNLTHVLLVSSSLRQNYTRTSIICSHLGQTYSANGVTSGIDIFEILSSDGCICAGYMYPNAQWIQEHADPKHRWTVSYAWNRKCKWPVNCSGAEKRYDYRCEQIQMHMRRLIYSVEVPNEVLVIILARWYIHHTVVKWLHYHLAMKTLVPMIFRIVHPYITLHLIKWFLH